MALELQKPASAEGKVASVVEETGHESSGTHKKALSSRSLTVRLGEVNNSDDADALRLHAKMREIDTNGDGIIEERELLEFISRELRKSKQVTYARRVIYGLVLLFLLVILGNMALTYTVVKISEETHVDSSGRLVAVSGGSLIKTASDVTYTTLLDIPKLPMAAISRIEELSFLTTDGVMHWYKKSGLIFDPKADGLQILFDDIGSKYLQFTNTSTVYLVSNDNGFLQKVEVALPPPEDVTSRRRALGLCAKPEGPCLHSLAEIKALQQMGNRRSSSKSNTTNSSQFGVASVNSAGDELTTIGQSVVDYASQYFDSAASQLGQDQTLILKFPMYDFLYNYGLKYATMPAPADPSADIDKFIPYRGVVAKFGTYVFADSIEYQRNRTSLRVAIRFAHDPISGRRRRWFVSFNSGPLQQYDEITLANGTVYYECVDPTDLNLGVNGGSRREIPGDEYLPEHERLLHQHIRHHIDGFGHIHVHLPALGIYSNNPNRRDNSSSVQLTSSVPSRAHYWMMAKCHDLQNSCPSCAYPTNSDYCYTWSRQDQPPEPASSGESKAYFGLVTASVKKITYVFPTCITQSDYSPIPQRSDLDQIIAARLKGNSRRELSTESQFSDTPRSDQMEKVPDSVQTSQAQTPQSQQSPQVDRQGERREAKSHPAFPSADSPFTSSHHETLLTTCNNSLYFYQKVPRQTFSPPIFRGNWSCVNSSTSDMHAAFAQYVDAMASMADARFNISLWQDRMSSLAGMISDAQNIVSTITTIVSSASVNGLFTAWPTMNNQFIGDFQDILLKYQAVLQTQIPNMQRFQTSFNQLSDRMCQYLQQMYSRAQSVYVFQNNMNLAINASIGCLNDANYRSFCNGANNAISSVTRAANRATANVATVRATMDQLDQFYSQIGAIRLRAWGSIVSYFGNLSTVLAPQISAMQQNYTANAQSTNSILTSICATELVPLPQSTNCQICPSGICITFPCQPSWSLQYACSTIGSATDYQVNATASGKEITTRISSLSDFFLDILSTQFELQQPSIQLSDPYQPNYLPNFPSPSSNVPWNNLDLTLPLSNSTFPTNATFANLTSTIMRCDFATAGTIITNWNFP